LVSSHRSSPASPPVLFTLPPPPPPSTLIPYTTLFRSSVADKLKERDKTSNSELVMYLVAPFLNSLGYDTHNLDEVDLDVGEGSITSTGHEDLTIIVTLNDD